MKPFLNRYMYAHLSSEAKVLLLCSLYNWALEARKTCLWKFAINKGADQPAHPRILISVFVIRLLKRIISRLATSEISLFYLESVAEETVFETSFGGNPEDRFSRDQAHMCASSEGYGNTVQMHRLV